MLSLRSPRISREITDLFLNLYSATCATITPMTKAKVSELASGSILEVRSDDPAARDGMPAWSHLTGNDLLAATADQEAVDRLTIEGVRLTTSELLKGRQNYHG